MMVVASVCKRVCPWAAHRQQPTDLSKGVISECPSVCKESVRACRQQEDGWNSKHVQQRAPPDLGVPPVRDALGFVRHSVVRASAAMKGKDAETVNGRVKGQGVTPPPTNRTEQPARLTQSRGLWVVPQVAPPTVEDAPP